jgi:hypothetical protein
MERPSRSIKALLHFFPAHLVRMATHEVAGRHGASIILHRQRKAKVRGRTPAAATV